MIARIGVTLLCSAALLIVGLVQAQDQTATSEAVERDPNAVYSVEENFRYINEVLAKLNNNDECVLPSWDEVDELQRSYGQLEEALGGVDQLEAKLDEDQKLCRDTLLDQWTLFQQRMTAGVVIKSSKKRAFLGKVEKYQEAKHGSSVCTRFVDNLEVTNKIFVKNPIVRYVTHIQTGRHKDVPDFPAEPEVPDEPQAEPEPEPKPEPEPEAEPEAKMKVIEVPIPDGPLHLTIEYVPINTNNEDNYDPLADVPSPAADDPEPEPEPETPQAEQPDTEVQPEPETEPEPEAEPEPEPAPEPEPEPVYDPNAPELVELEVDNLDLAKLDKPEPKEWDFDYANGELKWPDEAPAAKFDETDDLVLKDWSKFLENPQLCQRADGSLYDCSQRHNLAAKPGAEQRRRQFVDSVKVHMDLKQAEAIMGWVPDRWDPETERRVRVPAGQREPPQVRHDDGWSRLYSGRFCRISYNKKNLANSRGVRAMKTLLGKDDYSAKKKLLQAQNGKEY